MPDSSQYEGSAGPFRAERGEQVPAERAEQVPAEPTEPTEQIPAVSAGAVPAESDAADTDAAGTPPTRTAAVEGLAVHRRTGAVGRAWRAFRGWRRARPFWAGILVGIAGAELLMIPLPVHAMGLILHIGAGGVLGILIGAILIAIAFLLWFNPAQRVFYSVVAVLLAVAALVASNLGGFLIGTILGVVGGSLAFAWTADPQATTGRKGRRRGLRRAAVSPAGRDVAIGTGPQADYGGNGSTPIHGFAAIPVVLAIMAGVLHLTPAGTGLASASAAGASPAGASPAIVSLDSVSLDSAAKPALCIPGLPPIPGVNVCPSPSPSPTPAPSSSPSPDPSSPAAPGSSPSPSGSPSASPSPAQSAGSTPSPSPSPSPRAGTKPGFAVASAPSILTAARAVITGFAYDGLVTVPTSAGKVQMMQFSATTLDLTGIDLQTSQDGVTLTTQAPSLDLTGHVVLYATKLSGDLLGVPISITPGSPLATILQLIAPLTKAIPVPMTNVVTDQPYTSASGMSVSGLEIS